VGRDVRFAAKSTLTLFAGITGLIADTLRIKTSEAAGSASALGSTMTLCPTLVA
jgi:hypothetical protein